LWSLGIAASQRGDLPQAIEFYRSSIASNDRFSTSHQDLGIALRAQGRLGEAETSLRRAIDLDPGNVVARSTLFDLLLAATRIDEAESVAAEVVRRFPLYAPGRYDLGRLRYLQAENLERDGGEPQRVRDHFEAALRELREGLRLSSDEATSFNCGFAAGSALARLGRPAEAVPLFERALAVRPDRPALGGAETAWWWRCQIGLVRALAASGNDARARERAERLEQEYSGALELAEIRRALGP
jgi:tetratricopeptide (TPR) repeat protein